MIPRDAVRCIGDQSWRVVRVLGIENCLDKRQLRLRTELHTVRHVGVSRPVETRPSFGRFRAATSIFNSVVRLIGPQTDEQNPRTMTTDFVVLLSR
jgi:hypothetical protein